jgi:hypothetical protein
MYEYILDPYITELKFGNFFEIMKALDLEGSNNVNKIPLIINCKNVI